jgi:hypothetical protein
MRPLVQAWAGRMREWRTLCSARNVSNASERRIGPFYGTKKETHRARVGQSG